MSSTTSSCSSESSSVRVVKKKKKEKAPRKSRASKKKERGRTKCRKGKSENKSKGRKDSKQESRAAAWECDRPLAIRLVGQLINLDTGVAAELESVFSALDDGETSLLREARCARVAAAKESGGCLLASGGVVAVDAVVGEAISSPLPAQCSWEAQITEPAQGPQATKPKIGPQLPMPNFGAVADEELSASDLEGGPQTQDKERLGVNLDELDDEGSASRREEWMTTPHESITGVFSDLGSGGKGFDRFQVGRSKEECQQFEEAFKSRGQSLLQQVRDGAFASNEEELSTLRKRKMDVTEVWGTSAVEAAPMAAATQSRRAFDPEHDLKVNKPLTATDFSKLVENSSAGLAGRFARSHVAASFL